MEDKTNTIAIFWQAFQHHAKELATLTSADHPLYTRILYQLQRVHPGLFFEFSTDNDEAELMITADGDRALFPLVESIVANAPETPGWSIHALKPKLGFPVTATWEGLSVEIADVVFDPLEHPGSQEIGLRIFVPGLSLENVDDAHNALLRALDHALGERGFAESVKYTEVLPLPDDKSAEDYIPLIDLETYINRRRRQAQGGQ